jgi:hypothetical protein
VHGPLEAIGTGWDQAYAFIGLVGAIVAGGMLMLRWRLGSYFVTHADHNSMMRQLAADNAQVNERLKRVEAQVGECASAQDARLLANRIGSVETLLAGNTEKILGVAEGVRRVEHIMNIFVEHQISAERKS